MTVSGLTLGGADATNYTLAQPTDLTANITASALTVTGITANGKTYDGTTTATLNLGGATLNGMASGDAVTLNTGSAAGAFADANVGTGKTVTVSGLALAGPDAGNYTLTQPATTANITTATVSVAGVTANNKVYDGTTAATLNAASAALVGVVSGDDVTLDASAATGTFDDKNVGTCQDRHGFGPCAQRHQGRQLHADTADDDHHRGYHAGRNEQHGRILRQSFRLWLEHYFYCHGDRGWVGRGDTHRRGAIQDQRRGSRRPGDAKRWDCQLQHSSTQFRHEHHHHRILR